MHRTVTTIARDSAAAALIGSLRWVYGRIASGKSGKALPATPQDAEAQIVTLIRNSATQAGVIGFGTGIGGLFTLPLTLPANIAGVAALQINMVQEIARMRGHDLASQQVETLTLACLTGNAAVDVLKRAGIKLGGKAAEQALGKISSAVLLRINQAVGFRLVTKGGTTGLVNLGKAVPLVGGLVGGTIDGLSTAAVGNAAKALFPAKGAPDDAPFAPPPPTALLASPASP